jgi:hypothetical protein
MPSKFHPMFELQLTHREKKCGDYLDWVTDRVNVHKSKYDVSLRKRKQCFKSGFRYVYASLLRRYAKNDYVTFSRSISAIIHYPKFDGKSREYAIVSLLYDSNINFK